LIYSDAFPFIPIALIIKSLRPHLIMLSCWSLFLSLCCMGCSSVSNFDVTCSFAGTYGRLFCYQLYAPMKWNKISIDVHSEYIFFVYLVNI
jgi:hypothetical protein